MSLQRALLVEAILAAAGLPTRRTVEKLLEKAKQRAEIVVSYTSGGERWAEAARKLLEPAAEKGAAKIILVKTAEWPRGLPQPAISLGGELGHRYMFYGLPEDLLLPLVLHAVAAAAGAWSPSCAGIPRVEGVARLYVVPGLPCARALHAALPVVYCCGRAALHVVNVETMQLQGLPLPVERVPAWQPEGAGEPLVAVPRSPAEAARFWPRSVSE